MDEDLKIATRVLLVLVVAILLIAYGLYHQGQTKSAKLKSQYYNDQVILQNTNGDTLKIYNEIKFKWTSNAAIIIETPENELIYLQGGIITAINR